MEPSQFETWLKVEVSQCLFFIHLLNELFYPSCLTYDSSTFLLITFSILNFFWIVFCSSFAQNVPTVSSPLRSSITCVYGAVFFNGFNHKNFFRQICSVNICKNAFLFWYSNSTTNFKFRILIINFFTRVNISACFTSTGFILIAVW